MGSNEALGEEGKKKRKSTENKHDWKIRVWVRGLISKPRRHTAQRPQHLLSIRLSVWEAKLTGLQENSSSSVLEDPRERKFLKSKRTQPLRSLR